MATLSTYFAARFVVIPLDFQNHARERPDDEEFCVGTSPMPLASAILSHFSRTFRKRFTQSPAAYRGSLNWEVRIDMAKLAAAPMIHIAGGTFWMGSSDHYPEEAPVRQAQVDPFWIDEALVTNRDYLDFVDSTGHVTLAELAPNPAHYPDADPAMMKPGSSLFVRPRQPVPLTDTRAWWHFSFGTDWRHPWGPRSSIEGIMGHPVVHVSHADAVAYATWANKRLPTEAEWEFAARGGLDRSAFAWGDEFEPGGKPQANYWQGAFPSENKLTDGFERTSPARHFPANGYGLYDMIGNVWEWTDDWYEDRRAQPMKSCCIPRNPRGTTEEASRDPHDPGAAFGRKVLKGGSHLCAENYCQRYRPPARYPQTIDTSTSHIGFRCARDARAAPEKQAYVRAADAFTELVGPQNLGVEIE